MCLLVCVGGVRTRAWVGGWVCVCQPPWWSAQPPPPRSCQVPTTKAACSSVRLQADTHFEKAAQALLPRHPAQPPPTCTWRHGRRGLCTSPIACRHCFHTVLACGVVLRPRNPSCRATPRSRHRCARAWRHGRPWGGGVGTPRARHAQDALPQKPGPGRGRQPEGGWLCSACKYWAGWGWGIVCHVQEEVSRTSSDGPGRDGRSLMVDSCKAHVGQQPLPIIDLPQHPTATTPPPSRSWTAAPSW